MPSRETIIIAARSIASGYKGVQPDGTFPSWETLKNIYDRAMAIPPDWAIQSGANLKALKAGRWMRKDGRPGGTNEPKPGVSWCGIFATHVLNASGVPVKWHAFTGIAPLPQRSAATRAMKFRHVHLPCVTNRALNLSIRA